MNTIKPVYDRPTAEAELDRSPRAALSEIRNKTKVPARTILTQHPTEFQAEQLGKKKSILCIFHHSKEMIHEEKKSLIGNNVKITMISKLPMVFASKWII